MPVLLSQEILHSLKSKQMEDRDFTTFMIDKSSFCLFEQAQNSCQKSNTWVACNLQNMICFAWFVTEIYRILENQICTGFLKQNKNEQNNFAYVAYLHSFMVTTRFFNSYLCFRRRLYFLLFPKDAALGAFWKLSRVRAIWPGACREGAAPHPFGWLCWRWQWEVSYTQFVWQRWRLSTIWRGKCTFPFMFLNHQLRAKCSRGQPRSRSAC